MSGEPPMPLDTTTTSSLWDRITEFATRNRKTIIYTTAAITVLVTAGGVYYYTQRGEGGDGEAKRKREKGSRKKKQKQTTSDEESQLNGDLTHRNTVESRRKATRRDGRGRRGIASR